MAARCIEVSNEGIENLNNDSQQFHSKPPLQAIEGQSCRTTKVISWNQTSRALLVAILTKNSFLETPLRLTNFIALRWDDLSSNPVGLGPDIINRSTTVLRYFHNTQNMTMIRLMEPVYCITFIASLL